MAPPYIPWLERRVIATRPSRPGAATYCAHALYGASVRIAPSPRAIIAAE
jgi:hypothetical protein